MTGLHPMQLDFCPLVTAAGSRIHLVFLSVKPSFSHFQALFPPRLQIRYLKSRKKVLAFWFKCTLGTESKRS